MRALGPLVIAATLGPSAEATTFEVRHANFTPARDLDILILYRPKL
jgi:hypothetical protein